MIKFGDFMEYYALISVRAQRLKNFHVFIKQNQIFCLRVHKNCLNIDRLSKIDEFCETSFDRRLIWENSWFFNIKFSLPYESKFIFWSQIMEKSNWNWSSLEVSQCLTQYWQIQSFQSHSPSRRVTLGCLDRTQILNNCQIFIKQNLNFSSWVQEKNHFQTFGFCSVNLLQNWF